MAKNNLTPSQDVLTREFYEEVAAQTEGVDGRRLRGILLDLLGYQVLANGNRVSKDIEPKIPFGSGTAGLDKYPDEWRADLHRALEALEDEAVNNNNTDQADSGEPSPNTEVR